MIIYVCTMHEPLIDKEGREAEAEQERLQEASSSTPPRLTGEKK